jgi:hypothetical protein
VHPLTRQSRHPVMLGLMVMIVIISVWQILSGPGRHETLWSLPHGTYILLALVNVLGCISAISATIQSDAWTAAAFELCGALILCGPLSIYLWAVITTAQFPDTDIVTALLAGALIGLMGRAYLIIRDVIGVVSDGQAPPVGDLDLLTADKVNSVADLVSATHGGGIERQASALELPDVPTPPRHAL